MADPVSVAVLFFSPCQLSFRHFSFLYPKKGEESPLSPPQAPQFDPPLITVSILVTSSTSKTYGWLSNPVTTIDIDAFLTYLHLSNLGDANLCLYLN